MGFFDQVTKEDIEATIPPIWDQKERVTFTITDFKEEEDKERIVLLSIIETGPNKGKRHRIYISDKKNEISQRRKIQFLLGFWTREQIESREVDPSKLVGRRAECTFNPRIFNEATYYDYWDWKDKGVPQPGDAVAAEDNVPF